MTDIERYKVHSTIYQFLIENHIDRLPIDIFSLCSTLKIEELKPLSALVNDGLGREEAFAVWGNRDGTLTSLVDKHGTCHNKIAYNDSILPSRQHFTILEECSHVILEHYKDPDFNIFTQRYDNEKYVLYDESARMCAGSLACSPKFYYQHRAAWQMYISQFADVLNISKSCAKVRARVYETFESDITSHPLYSKLPNPVVDLPPYILEYERILTANRVNVYTTRG